MNERLMETAPKRQLTTEEEIGLRVAAVAAKMLSSQLDADGERVLDIRGGHQGRQFKIYAEYIDRSAEKPAV